MRNKNWIKYLNGNYTVYFNRKNGTKIRQCSGGEIQPAFPENCDVMISTRCNMECPWCYAGCTNTGSFGKLLGWKFLEGMHPYTEMAVNINFPLHPQLEEFLCMMKEKEVIVNATVNQNHLYDNIDYIRKLQDDGLIHGIGISLTNCMDAVKHNACLKNVVFHVINGLFSKQNFECMKGQGLKVLILGYKDLMRGKTWHLRTQSDIREKQSWLYDSIDHVLDGFEVVSFDNLALEQLKIRRIMSEDEWNTHYMGDDATVTFAINLVNGTFSPSSVSEKAWPIEDRTLEDMLKIVRVYKAEA